MKRTQHARDVVHRGTLMASLGQRARRFAFEIDDDEVLTGVEHLAEMQIAMDSHPHHAQPAAQEGIEARADFGLMSDYLLRLLAEILRERGAAALERAHHSTQQIAHRLIHRPLVEPRKRFRRKIRIVSAGTERQVKLRDAAPQQARRIEVGTDQLGGERVGLREVEQIDEGLLRRRCGLRPSRGHFEISMQLRQRILPRVAFVGDEALQHRQVAWLRAPAGVVIDPTRERRHV